MLDNPYYFRHSSRMSRDPLSAVLSLIEARAVYAGGFTAGGDWAIRFPPPEKIKFFVIARGACVIAVDGFSSAFHLRCGDVFLLSARASFIVASDLAVPHVDARQVFEGADPLLAAIGQGDDFLFLGGHVDLGSAGGRLFVDNLPPAIHLHAEDSGVGQLQWLIRELVQETMAATPGADAACSGLAHLMFLQILRSYLSRERGVDVGWLRAACDARLAPALGLMHSDPARNWHLPELAKEAAMSRTTFATYFKAVAGVSPLNYLAEWRMRLAERRLQEGGQSVAMIAQSVGYASEAAFSTAFKRVMGHSPRRRSQAKQRRTGLAATAFPGE
ncbi:AraC family transcriptional regulator [Ensifer sp. LC163]|uniref:AraC family transcriptional regulator n=1 Tax=Ensifer sp. LC163 TaxID=1120652 RepID=UPI0008132D06|nr:AraC family transcriptional regulator [Ensifer sp. LC163]OCP15661.1 AraC family transcriptional regulator [Ensifer sp. LC163]